jgi:N-acetyl-anhydromuramyl-L-alanine amidase AmpD
MSTRPISSFAPLVMLLLGQLPANSQPEQNAQQFFEEASAEFEVPVGILEAVGFVESHWTMVKPEPRPAEPGHVSPPAYGIMGLRNDDWFGHSLLEASKLIGLDPPVLQEEPRANVRGAAALLREIARRHDVSLADNNLLSWVEVLAEYSGIPQRTVQGDYVEGVYRILQEGYHEDGISIEPRAIDPERFRSILQEGFSPGKVLSPSSEDYPPAVWDPSGNYSSRGGAAITHVVIHDTEGSFAGSVSWLQNPSAQASAHYIFRSADGYLKQLVREADRAWHVSCWNAWTIGIEHEGYVSQPQYFTPVMYQQSALLVRHLCDRYGIAKDRLRILGHNVWTEPILFSQLGWSSCNNHTDPGQFWNWNYFLALIVADSTPPSVVIHYPAIDQQRVPIYKGISITFDREMELFSTQGAFSVLPAVPGKFSWSSDGRTLEFTADNYLAPSSSYVVTLSTAARGSGGGALDSTLQFGFSTEPPDNAGPEVVAAFPPDGMTEVSPFMGFQVRFDEPVVFSSFANRVQFTDLADTAALLAVGSVVYEDIDDSGRVSFQPVNPLQYAHSYRLRLLPGLRDIYGNESVNEARVEFSVLPTPVAQGVVIDDFESNSLQWQQPLAGAQSRGLVSANTNFSISSAKKRSGGYSGKLMYEFSDPDSGVCDLTTNVAPAVVESNGWVGLWLFGDYSRNNLAMAFGTSDAGTSAVSLGPIDWYGWKFVMISTTEIGGTVTSLEEILVAQNAAGDRSGVLYLDDLQLETTTDVVETGRERPATFVLYQNYPNPFNPSTNISFDLARDEAVRLTLFNSLGQAVAVLLDKHMDAGPHTISFQADRGENPLPSGVYLYRLHTSAGSAVRKMVLIR